MHYSQVEQNLNDSSYVRMYVPMDSVNKHTTEYKLCVQVINCTQTGTYVGSQHNAVTHVNRCHI